MNKTGPTNEQLRNLISELKKASALQKSGLWKRVANDLEKSTRQRRVVNISKLNRYTKSNETVIIPGKVLGAGQLNHELTIAAFSFSEGAKQVIKNSKGKCLTIQDLLKQNPQGKNIKIIG